MENLLRTDYTAHYGEVACTIANLSEPTSAAYFELEDTAAKEIVIHLNPGLGMAVFNNPSSHGVTIINHDKFVTALSPTFGNGKKRCDIIAHTNTNTRHFLLGELKDRKADGKNKEYRKKAKEQLIESIGLLMAVPSIHAYASRFTSRRCCIFNKQSGAPAPITAPTAFGRMAALLSDGVQLPNPQIEGHGFKLYEYLGGTSYQLS